jgi:phosphoglycolate phosphatase
LKNNFDLIVFDWDGTLIDSTATITTCMQLAARDMGVAVPTRERASHVIGMGLIDALRYAVPELPAERYQELADHYRKHWMAIGQQDMLFDGVKEMLATLKTRHDFMAVATGKSRRGLDRALVDTGLDAMFDWTRCADETQSKPHPAMLHELMDKFGVDAERTLMIGDTTHDSQMAENAHVKAVSVTYGAHPRAQLETLKPVAIVESVAQLAAWLAANG